MCAGVTGAVATGVSHTADRSGGRTGALVAKPFVLGSITGAFACRWRIGAKHLLAPLGAIPISTENAANAAQTEKATDGGGDDSSQRVAARSGTGQCFSQLVKFRRLHAGPPLVRREIAEKDLSPSSFFSTIRNTTGSDREAT